MNHPNLPEEQMRLWTPRRPSASRRAEIFSHAEQLSAAAERHAPAKFFWGALAPTMACALLTLAVFNHGGDGRPAASARAWSGSNFVADASHTAQNRWESVTFDWTNRGVFRSIIPFASATNFSH